MREPDSRNDLLTAASLGLLAMCIVTFDHEALGHGSACVLLHGHIRLLTSSLFRCDVQSGWIDPAGPAINLLVGTLALVCTRFVPARRLNFRLLLIFIASFSYFWEGGYAIRAMLKRDGDLYYFAQFLLGDVSGWQRCVGAVAGFALYVFAARFTANSMLEIWPGAGAARTVLRTVWTSATVGAALAALTYAGPGWQDLKDAVLEIGGASFPLLFIPPKSRQIVEAQPSLLVARSTITIVISALAYAIFIASLGRGVGLG